MAVETYRLVGPNPQLAFYLCDTEGELPTAANSGDIAYVKSNGRVIVHGTSDWIDTGTTLAQREALGGTSGAPSASNRYVTEEDLAEKLAELLPPPRPPRP